MSLQNQYFKFQNNINKRNYNEMISNANNYSSNNDSFIKNQLFKSALKYGGPINQDLIIHQKKNVRKSMGYQKPETNSIFDINSYEKEKNKNAAESASEVKEKNETSNNLSNRPERNKITFGQQKTVYNTISRNITQTNFYDGIKVENNNNDFGNKSEKRTTDFVNIIGFTARNETNKNDNNANNNIVQEKHQDINEKKEETTKAEIKETSNQFIASNNIFINNNYMNNNEPSNPFHSSTNSFFIDKSNATNNNIVENPFKDISKNRIENPFKDFKPLNSNNSNNSSNDKQIINPFKSNNNNIINPFISSNNNPFSNNSSTSNNNIFNNNNIQIKNPFIQNTSDNNINPFISIGNNSSMNISNNNANNTNEVINPFQNPFRKTNINDNPFLTQENISNKMNNPFRNINSNTNIFYNIQSQIPNNNNVNINNEDDDNDNGGENINVEEEIKIEKDESKLKEFKEIKYERNDKFYEVKIENLQYFDRKENKYISLGNGIFNLQEENDGGKKRGLFVLRDINTKNIKIQGTILDKSNIEKSKLKNGVEFIKIKNILATYSKYDKDKISQETNLTYIRIKIDLSKIDELFNRASEFFENFKINKS